jgi:MFS family permease
MGSLALLPLGYVLCGPLADLLGRRTVLGLGGAFGPALLAIGLLPRSTRELGDEQFDRIESAHAHAASE